VWATCLVRKKRERGIVSLFTSEVR
jgi:hypothetical protein